jgi:hypothetical protein
MCTIKTMGLLYFVHDGTKRISNFFMTEEGAIDWCIDNQIDLNL